MNDEPDVGPNATRVEMTLWHPDCWNIAVSERNDAGILGHGLFRAGGHAYTRLTVYGDTVDAVDRAIADARASSDTYAVFETAHDARLGSVTPGNASKELLVQRSLRNQVSGAFLARGFVYADPIDIRDGVEQWSVMTGHDRDYVRRALDEIRREEDAVIEVTEIRDADTAASSGTLPLDALTSRQREVFQLARRRGYYDYPKRVTPAELADELGVTTSTFHEHLHKAEAKVLDDPTASGRSE